MDTEGKLLISESESMRFSLNVYRGVFSKELNPTTLAAEIINKGIDLAILRLPCKEPSALRALDELGMPYLVCDMLVYYHAELTSLKITPPRNADLNFIRATAGHGEVLDQLVERIFADYQNHYSANPLTSPHLLAAYRQWAQTFIDSDETGREVFIAYRASIPLGFIACATQGDCAEVVLNGVIPGATGQGVYGNLIKYVQRRYKKSGLRRIKISTQMTNAAVQKVWAREGFVLQESFYTVHVMPMMGLGLVRKKRHELIFSKKQLDDFYKLADEANEASFLARLLSGIVSPQPAELLAPGSPACNASLPNDNYSLIKVLLPDRTYTVEVGFFPSAASQRCERTLTRIFDDSGNICAYSYGSPVTG